MVTNKNSSKPRINFKIILTLVSLLAITVMIVVSWEGIASTLSKIGEVDKLWLGSLVPIQIASYFALAKFYQSFLSSYGRKLKLSVMYRLGLELNFVNQAFPSGGVSGFSYAAYRLKPFEVATSRSALLQVGRFAMTFVSFVFLLTAALIMLAIDDRTSGLTFTIALVIILFVFGFVIGGYNVLSNSNLTAKAAKFIVKVGGKLGSSVSSRLNEDAIVAQLTSLASDIKELKKSPLKLVRPFIWSLLLNTLEIAAIYVVYLAFGEQVNPGGVIIAYAVANIAGIIAVLPAGIGVYESLTALVMVSVGIPPEISLSVVIMYRILNLAIFLPIGYVLYQKAILGQNE